MRMKMNFNRWTRFLTNAVGILVFFWASNDLQAQGVPQGINYQGVARDAIGNILGNQSVSIRLGIYGPTVSGTLKWQEVHHVTTNSLGLFYLVIGQGTTSGGGSLPSFSSIDWGSSDHFVKIEMDITGGSSYVAVDTIQLWSVPYAMYSGTSNGLLQALRLNQLLDVDTLGVVPGYVLKYNGSVWLPAPDLDSDTALYAFSSDHAIHADTATYAYNSLNPVDSVMYSTYSDSAGYSNGATTSVTAGHSNYCDTAYYALNTGSTYSYWNISGNSGISATTNFIGTVNSSDLVFKTNNQERMRILASNGRLGIGTATPLAALHVVGSDGLLAEGTFGSGTIPTTGAGTRMMWYPKKAAFRAGTVTGTQWDDANIGIYSFAANNNNTASGAYSTAFGNTSLAGGQYSFAACQGAFATGIASVSMGNASNAAGAYSVALGRQAQAMDTCAVALGYHNTASGKYSVSIGYETVSSGQNSMALGFWSSTNGKKGSFVFADNSSASVTTNTADNQFMVRASGGVILYSNSALTSGVTLPAGGGSWSVVSDRNKKENFKKVETANILKKLEQMEVTSWNYKSQDPSIRHIGPMAQDFYQLFGYGESDTTITMVDVDGVSLAAIQELEKRTRELKKKSEEVAALKAKIDLLELQKLELDNRLNAIEKKIKQISSDNSAVSRR